VQAAKKSALNVEASFLEPLIDACVMECYLRDHMAESGLLFQGITAKVLTDFNTMPTKPGKCNTSKRSTPASKSPTSHKS
tara:strand:- start:3401 stop:3640 length:240 start_codon:yes stop_codon:yes gene_type:complete